MEKTASAESVNEENGVSYGACLSAARESLDLSQDAVAKQLYLSRNTIDEIERQAFHPSIAAVYRRGYVASYARLLGLDESAILEAYDSTLPLKKTTSFFESTFMTHSNRSFQSRIFKCSSRLYCLIVLVFLVALLLGWVFQHLSSSKNQKPSSTVPVTHGHATLALPEQLLSSSPSASVSHDSHTQQSLVLPKNVQAKLQTDTEKKKLVHQSSFKTTPTHLQPNYTVTPVG